LEEKQQMDKVNPSMYCEITWRNCIDDADKGIIPLLNELYEMLKKNLMMSNLISKMVLPKDQIGLEIKV
jgi:hypothetical protein